MFKRREFLKAAGQTTALLLARPLLRAQNAGAENAPFRWNSEHIEVELSRSAPELLSLNIDGLGQGQRGANILNADRNIGGYQASVVNEGQSLCVEYRTATAPKGTPAGWTFEFPPAKSCSSPNGPRILTRADGFSLRSESGSQHRAGRFLATTIFWRFRR